MIGSPPPGATTAAGRWAADSLAGMPARADPLAPLAARPEVAAAVTTARSAVDALLSHRVLRHRSAEVTAEASLRGARASADLEGARVPLEELRARLVTGAAAPLPAPGGELLTGAVRLYAELGALAGFFDRAPRQALARLHVLAAQGLAEGAELGRPRPGDVARDPLGLGPPPPPDVVAARLDLLAHLLAGGTAAPALLVYAVTHGELLALRPFAVASGVVARAAARLVLVTRGLDPKSVSAPEVGHVELRAEYVDAARGYARGGPAEVLSWVEHCGRAVAFGAREGLAVCEALQRQTELPA